MKNLYLKRAFVFLIILVLIVASNLFESTFVKLFCYVLIILIISLLIFARNGKGKTLIEENNNETGNEERNFSPQEEGKPNTRLETNDRILTESELQHRISNANVTKLVPQDLNIHYRKIALEETPASSSSEVQFNYYLEKTLEVIKYVFDAHAAIFFWYRKDRNEVIFYNYAADEDGLQKFKYSLGTDIISKVIITENPIYTCNINSNVEEGLIRYYRTPIGIKSIAAVPVFINNKVIGVLAIDSKSEDAFGPEHIFTLGRFVRMITLILNMYDQKYQIDLVNQKLDALLDLIGISAGEFDERILMQRFIVLFDKLIEWDALGIVLYDPGT
ncbi:MAG: GAF domain-containing protein, partial [Ignavibacteria bacterium]